jgi:hypothetical protein
MRDKKRVACIITEYRENSHADVIVGKILEGYDQKGGPGPDLEVVSMFTDQIPTKDMSRPLAEKYKFPIVDSIEQAITLGKGEVSVDGVLLIGEHGQYPHNVKGQHCHPRPRFFEDTIDVFRKYRRVVPVFNDKHLAYNWHNAVWMYETSRELMIPFMAGSSLPVTYRRAPLKVAIGTEFESAAALGYSSLEAYGFHAIETLQCMVERRRGGETGVVAVQSLQGDAMFRALDAGRWSRELLDAMLKLVPHKEGDVERNCQTDKTASVFLIEYSDGLRAAVAMLNGHAAEFAFAGKRRGQAEPMASWFFLHDAKPFPHFAYLIKAIEQMIHTGHSSYPVERTLLTTGILDAAMTSLFLRNTRVETPHLANIRYQAVDYPFAPDPNLGVDLPGKT